MTPAEAILWKHIRGRRFDGLKFRRQQPINEARAIADFFCAAATLIVELDGDSHVGREPEDASRQARLEALGYGVLRFWNHEIYEDLDTVLDNIWMACAERMSPRAHPSPPTPLPQGERGEKQDEGRS
jgi:very-short-patch-repair endonuclease